MNLNGKGWYGRYLNLRKEFDHPFEINKIVRDKKIELDSDRSLYQLVQPTGLIYGHPLQLPHNENEVIKSIKVHDKMKIIMSESFFHNTYLKYEENIITKSDQEDLFHESTNILIDFYKNLYPEYYVGEKTFWGRKRQPDEIAEIILEKRINIRGGFSRNFWSSFFHNSLLFLDVYYFGSWIGGSKKSSEEIKAEKEEMRLAILKVIASAAYADNVLEKEEKLLFKYFLKSANLPLEKEKEAAEFLHSPVPVEDLKLPEFEDSWLLKKYFLEIALLTIWADRVVTPEEKDYLAALRKKLSFTQIELESSMIAIESFVLEHWSQVHYLRDKKDFSMVSEKVIERMTYVVSMNKDRVVQEMRESKELLDLIYKSRRQNLTPEEKLAVKTQIIDILKLIPPLTVIILPFTFITLPVLLKILPKSAFPTAFQD